MSDVREIWFRSRNGAQWRPVSNKGWAAMALVIGGDLLVAALCCWLVVVTDNLAWIAPVLLMGPVTIGVFFHLVSRHGEIVADKI